MINKYILALIFIINKNYIDNIPPNILFKYKQISSFEKIKLIIIYVIYALNIINIDKSFFSILKNENVFTDRIQLLNYNNNMKMKKIVNFNFNDKLKSLSSSSSSTSFSS